MDNPPSSRPSPGRRALVAVPALALLLVAACGGDGDGGALAGIVREPALQVGEVEVTGADGTPVAMRADDGELLVAYFGYTSCPDICPTTMSDISIALGDLPEGDADRVTVAFVTVDPERDTIEVLDGYLGHFFDAGGLALRPQYPGELADAAEAFGVQYEVAAHEPGDEAYDVAHTAVTYVIDDTGTVVVEWPFGFEPASMTDDFQTLLDQEEP